MSARSSSRSQLVERPKASSLPRLRMSAGRQGSKREAQQLHLERHRPGARRRGVDALAEALQQGAQLGVERRRLALGGAADAQRPHQPVDRQALRAGDLGEPAGDDAAVEVHLPEPVLAVAEALREPEVGGCARPRCGERPSGRGAPAPRPSSPSSSIVPSCLGSGRRASQCQAAAAVGGRQAGPGGARPAGRPAPPASQSRRVTCAVSIS